MQGWAHATSRLEPPLDFLAKGVGKTGETVTTSTTVAKANDHTPRDDGHAGEKPEDNHDATDPNKCAVVVGRRTGPGVLAHSPIFWDTGADVTLINNMKLFLDYKVGRWRLQAVGGSDNTFIVTAIGRVLFPDGSGNWTLLSDVMYSKEVVEPLIGEVPLGLTHTCVPMKPMVYKLVPRTVEADGTEGSTAITKAYSGSRCTPRHDVGT